MRTYLASYNHEGLRWNLEIQARDWDDAQARLSRISFAKLDGEVVAKIPVPGKAWGGLWSRLSNISSAIFSTRS